MIRVAVVDDQTLVRTGLISLLELSDEVVISGQAGDGNGALALVESDAPDVLLLDLRMPGRDGIDTLRELRVRGNTVPVLVLTTFDDDELVLEALKAGAKGYLLKDVTLEQLVDAIRTLAQGETLVQPALTDRLMRSLSALPTEEDALPQAQPLTPRETEILRLLSAGYTNRQIAAALHLAEGTVKNHVSNLLLKLGVTDRTRAVLRALHLGLLTEEGTA